jgi:YesN/AraC family two-component response regulator
MDGPSKVLIVEDDPTARDGFARLLSLDGFIVQTAGAAGEALQRTRTSAVDSIVADLNLPDFSAIDLLEAIRSEGLATPFLIVTGCATVQAAVAAMRLGAADFLEKPVDPDVFVAKVRDLTPVLMAVDRRIARVMQAICQDPARSLDLGRLARDVGLSASRLRHLFRQQAGCSIGEFRLRARLDRARLLLGTSNMRVSEVAYRTGFEDPRVFARAFRAAEGIGPRAYRRNFTANGTTF